MLACLSTSGPQAEATKKAGGHNRFIAGGYPVDFTNARMTLRLRGEMLKRGTEVVMLIQGVIDGICSGWLLTGQPIQVTEDWSEPTLSFTPDPAHWKALGSRHDRTDMYGTKPLPQVLADVNTNIMLVMYPLNIVPMGPIDDDPHMLRAGHDYPVWQSKLPEGYITLEQVRIRFASV